MSEYKKPRHWRWRGFTQTRRILEWLADNGTLANAAKLGDLIGKLAIFVTMVTWLWESGARSQAAINADWQTILLAQTQKANAGRVEALEDLNRRKVVFYGLELTDGAKLPFLDLSGGKVEDSRFTDADLSRARFDEGYISKDDVPRLEPCRSQFRRSVGDTDGIRLLGPRSS